MVTLPPPQSHQQDHMYRHPGPYDMYQGHQQPLPYPQHPHDSQQPQVGFNQPAPRQRTAIACRYCRRRKVRLHRRAPIPSLTPSDPMPRLRRFSRRPLHELQPISSRMHLHPRFFTSTCLCTRTHRVPPSSKYGQNAADSRRTASLRSTGSTHHIWRAWTTVGSYAPTP